VTNNVLYLAGLGRSGSTILERMLGELDGVCPAGELVHLWHRGIVLDEPCGCGKPFSDCRFWSQVGDAAFGGWVNVPVDRIRALRRKVDRTRKIPMMLRHTPDPQFDRELREYTGYYVALYDAIRAVSGCAVVVDSSKHPSLAFALAARRDLDLRVVQMVRDPRAVAYSWTKATKRPEAELDKQAIAVFPTWPATRAARLWLGHNASLSLLRRFDVPLLAVRHEDLIENPRAALRRIADWVGLPAEIALPVSEAGVAELTSAHTVSGNPMRFKTGAVQIVADDSWRSESRRRDLAIVTAVTLPLLHHFGYPLRPTGSDTR
jgi:hypothetical protein